MAKSSKEELRYLEGKLRQNPDSILFARLADLYLSINRIDEAINLCETGIKKHPYYVTGHYIISKCYLEKKQFDHAEKELKRVFKFDPQYIAAHRDYGDLMAQIGWNSTCEESYQKITELDPFNTQAQQHINELKEKFKLHDNIKEEFNDELTEFEEEAIVSKDSIEIEEPEKPEVEETIEEFDEIFPEKDKTIEALTEDEDEDFSNILDDIFRDNGVSMSDESEEKIEPVEDQLEFSLEEKLQTTSLEDEDFSAQDIEKWLEQEEELEPIRSTEDNFDKEILSAKDISDDELASILPPEEDVSSDELASILPPEEDVSSDELASILPPEEDVSGDELAAILPPDKDISDDELAGILPPDKDISDDELAAILPPDEDISSDEFVDTLPPAEEPSTSQDIEEWLDTGLETEPIQSIDADFDENQESEEKILEKKKEKIVTPTLGEIYTAQHQYAKAIGVYEILKKNNPDNPIYQQKINYLKRKLEESQNLED